MLWLSFRLNSPKSCLAAIEWKNTFTMSLNYCTSRRKERRREYGKPGPGRVEPTYHTLAQKNPLTKSDLMKSIVSYSAVFTPSRFFGFVAVMALAALPALGAGSPKQLVEKDGDPSITVYNQGVTTQRSG